MRLIYDADKERLELALLRCGNDQVETRELIQQVLDNMKEIETSVHRALEGLNASA